MSKVTDSDGRDESDGLLYYAQGGQVRKRSIVTKHGDGTESFTLDFAVCTMTEYVGDEAARVVASLMNAGHDALAAPRGGKEG